MTKAFAVLTLGLAPLVAALAKAETGCCADPECCDKGCTGCTK